MSFILDALRKSEHERQRQTGPGFADIRGAAVARSGLPPWALILGALLLINVLVVVALAFRGNSADKGGAAVSAPTVESAPSDTPATTTGAAVTAKNAPAVAARVPPSAPPTRPPDVTLRAQTSPSVEARTAAPGAPASSERAEEPVLRAAPKPEPPPREPSAESYASLPTYGDVTLQGASLPDLHIDLHVYAAKPADRLVFINTRKYREGGQTPDGTTIERIIPDGVVLNHHGVRFLLPRQ